MRCPLFTSTLPYRYHRYHRYHRRLDHQLSMSTSSLSITYIPPSPLSLCPFLFTVCLFAIKKIIRLLCFSSTSERKNKVNQRSRCKNQTTTTKKVSTAKSWLHPLLLPLANGSEAFLNLCGEGVCVIINKRFVYRYVEEKLVFQGLEVSGGSRERDWAY